MVCSADEDYCALDTDLALVGFLHTRYCTLLQGDQGDVEDLLLVGTLKLVKAIWAHHGHPWLRWTEDESLWQEVEMALGFETFNARDFARKLKT